MKLLNDKGNTTIFIIGSFSMLLLFLLIVGSLAEVFILKEKASNNAEQASIVATGIVIDHLFDAVSEYDATLIDGENPLGPIVSDAIVNLKASSPHLSNLEARNMAINQVLKGQLPSNVRLPGIVTTHLSSANSKIPEQVRANIESNNGVVKGTIITFDGERIQVETSTRYKAFKYDDLLPEEKRYVKQKGKGPKLEFVQGLGGWLLYKEL